MDNFKDTEALLAWIVDFFSIHFGNSAVLKGGMALRLMHSPRYTNDVDYIFIPYGSKKDVKTIIESELSKVENLSFVSTLNSKALRFLLTYGGQSAQVEVTAEKECLSIPMSSALLSTAYGRPARILRILDPEVSFAHKIAAWNERELMRDLYDIYQYESFFKISPRIDILQMRLEKARSYKNIVAAQDFKNLVSKLRHVAETLNGDAIEELRPLLSEEELAGLAFRMRPSIMALCERLRKETLDRK